MSQFLTEDEIEFHLNSKLPNGRNHRGDLFVKHCYACETTHLHPREGHCIACGWSEMEYLDFGPAEMQRLLKLSLSKQPEASLWSAVNGINDFHHVSLYAGAAAYKQMLEEA